MKYILDFLAHNWFSLGLLLFIKPAINGVSKAIENGIAKRPEFLHEKNMEKFKIDSQKEIQVDSYYRNVSSSDMIETLEFWVGLISNPKKVAELTSEDYNKQSMSLIKFSSQRALKIFANMQQMSYRGLEGNESKQKYLIYVCVLIAQLKEDFTGQKMNPMDLLKAKINDFETFRDDWNQILEEIQNEIKATH